MANARDNEDELIQPISRETLLEMHNEAPREEIPAEMLRAGAARSFTLMNSDEPPRMVRAPDGRGWTIATESPLVEGLIGQDFAAARSRTRETVARRSSGGAAARPNAPFIPPWAGRGYHPIIAPRPKRRPLLRGRTLDTPQGADPFTYISNGDSRIPIYPQYYPERCICQILIYTQPRVNGFMDYQGQGTGFMVGPRLLMTAGHLRPKKPYVAWQIKVIPACYQGNSLYGDGYCTYAQYYKSYNTDPGTDLMLLRLYDDIGWTTGWMGTKKYNDNWEDKNYFSLCGYAYDYDEAASPLLEVGIAVEDDDDADSIQLPNGSTYDSLQLETSADVASGQSGGPLYSWFDNGGVYAIGVNHGTETDLTLNGWDQHQCSSGGPALTALVNWGYAHWS